MLALAQRLPGQVRVIAGLERMLATGLDMAAALHLAEAMGIDRRIAAEFLTEIEAALCAAMNRNEEAPDEGANAEGSADV